MITTRDKKMPKDSSAFLVSNIYYQSVIIDTI